MSQSTPAPTVFIIDDDANVRDAIAGLLKSAGHRSESFSSAQEFLSQALSDGPGCLILDVTLPGISGLDVQRRLLEAGVTLPVIVITGHGDISMSVRAMELGAVEFLTKPFQPQDLLDAVEQAFHRHR